MKKIIIKEIDQYKSTTYQDKIISEYLIYTQDGLLLDNYKIIIGLNQKNDYINELLLNSFNDENIASLTEESVEEISYKEYLISTSNKTPPISE